MLSALQAWYHSDASWRYQERLADPGALQPLLQPYFPDWRQSLAPPEPELREGVCTLRVSLGKVWRRIIAPSNLTLDDLVLTILHAFDFDCEHLYCFELRDPQGREHRIACPYESEAEAFTDEVQLGELPLPEGGTMTLVYDYGDEWHFTVTLESIGPSNPKLRRPRVIAKRGQPPPQYVYDDEER